MTCEFCNPDNQKDLIYKTQYTEFPNHPNQLWTWIDWEAGLPYLESECDWRWGGLVARHAINFCPVCGRRLRREDVKEETDQEAD